MEQRLQKVIAQAGICSRRKAEELILNGKVEVNGKIVRELGTKVAGDDVIKVNGRSISKEEKVYYVLYKPKGCLTTVQDEKGKDRPTIMNYAPKGERVFPVGRLDYDTSGVLLLTNDGQFANQMTHPRYHLPKTYLVNLDGMLDDEAIAKLRKGFTCSEGTFAPAQVRILEKDYPRGRMQIELTVFEGQNHQVKRMMEGLGCKVRKLHRSKFGCVALGSLRPGETRRLRTAERRELTGMAQESGQ